MIEPATKPTVKLTGKDGNAFNILGLVRKALIRAGADKQYINKYIEEATAGDYNDVLTVSMKYVKVI